MLSTALPLQTAAQYKSKSQIARILTEGWLSSEMYCPCCLNAHVKQLPDNTKVADFSCQRCRNNFQLKASSKDFRNKVVDGEFNTMFRYVSAGDAPNFFFLHYSHDEWVVKNLFLMPRFFITESIIEKRTPLAKTARRAGWTGCNILINRLPEEGRIAIIKNEKPIERGIVNKSWKKMMFLDNRLPAERGWTADVLRCVEELPENFELADAYSFESHLKALHPGNQHVRDKIRQQLQVLRDHNIIKFSSKGQYSKL